MTGLDPRRNVRGLGKGAGFRRLMAVAVVALFLMTSFLPLMSLESSNADAPYDGTYYNVIYHPYYETAPLS